MIWLTNDIHHSIFSCLVGTEYDLWIRINGDPLTLSYFSPGHTLTRTTDDFLQNDTTPTTRNWIVYRIQSIARVLVAYRTITSRSNITQHSTFLVFLRTHLYNTTRIPPIAWPIPTDIVYRAFWIDRTLSGEQHPFRHPTRQYSHHSLHISTLDDNNHANSRCVIPFDSTRSWTGTRAPVRHLAHDGTPWTSHYDSQGRPCLPDNPHSFPYPYVRPACSFSIPLTWTQAYAIQYMLFEEATSTPDTSYTRILVEIVNNTTGTVHTLLAGDVCIFSANRRWIDVSGTNSHKLHTNGVCLAHTPLARPGYTTSGNRSKHHYADIFLTFPVPPPGSHTPQGTSYGESQYPSENLMDTVKSFSNMRVLSHQDAQRQIEQHNRRITQEEGINSVNPNHRKVELVFQVRACQEQ